MEVAGRGGYSGAGVVVADQADGEVAQGGHDPGQVSGADLGSVFIEGDIADVVDPVFDVPVAADDGGEQSGGGLAEAEAGDRVDDWTVPGLVDTGRVALSLKEIHVMGATRRAFTPEYRSQAVGFVLDDDRSIAEVARNIGCHEYTLGKWVKKEREARDRADAERPVGESERVELIRLRAEKKDDTARIAQLEMQVAFAKKVAAWFANEQR